MFPRATINVPQTRWFKTTEILFFHSARVSKSQIKVLSKPHFLWNLWGAILPCLFLTSTQFWQLLALQIHHFNLYYVIICHSPCVILSSYTDTSHNWIKGPPYSTIASSKTIISARTLFPNKVTLWSTGG